MWQSPSISMDEWNCHLDTLWVNTGSFISRLRMHRKVFLGMPMPVSVLTLMHLKGSFIPSKRWMETVTPHWKLHMKIAIVDVLLKMLLIRRSHWSFCLNNMSHSPRRNFKTISSHFTCHMPILGSWHNALKQKTARPQGFSKNPPMQFYSLWVVHTSASPFFSFFKWCTSSHYTCSCL